MCLEYTIATEPWPGNTIMPKFGTAKQKQSLAQILFRY